MALLDLLLHRLQVHGGRDDCSPSEHRDSEYERVETYSRNNPAPPTWPQASGTPPRPGYPTNQG